MHQNTQTAVIDPRHLKRATLMQELFASSFADQGDELSTTAAQILAEKDKLDQAIAQFAKERPLTEINKVDLAILRLIVFESTHKKTPKKVLINEAVELAKEFGSEGSSKFINGVLGKLLATGKT